MSSPKSRIKPSQENGNGLPGYIPFSDGISGMSRRYIQRGTDIAHGYIITGRSGKHRGAAR